MLVASGPLGGGGATAGRRHRVLSVERRRERCARWYARCVVARRRPPVAMSHSSLKVKSRPSARETVDGQPATGRPNGSGTDRTARSSTEKLMEFQTAPNVSFNSSFLESMPRMSDRPEFGFDTRQRQGEKPPKSCLLSRPPRRRVTAPRDEHESSFSIPEAHLGPCQWSIGLVRTDRTPRHPRRQRHLRKRLAFGIRALRAW